MARERSPNRDKAFEIYREHKGNITNREIANMLGEDEKKIAVWKQRDKWNEKTNVVQHKKESCTTNKKTNKTLKSKELSTEVITEKQKLFCSYFIKYRNKTKAYQKAYECSYDNAHAHAYELWQNVAVRGYIDQKLKEFRDNVGLEAQDIVQKYMDIAFADITDFMEFGIKEIDIPDEKTAGAMKKIMFNYIDFKDSCDVDGTLISEVRQSKDSVSIKLNDKMKALEWLGKNVDVLDAAAKQRLELEKQKFGLEKSKVKAGGGNTEGNISALLNAIHKSGDKK